MRVSICARIFIVRIGLISKHSVHLPRAKLLQPAHSHYGRLECRCKSIIVGVLDPDTEPYFAQAEVMINVRTTASIATYRGLTLDL